MTQPPKPQPIRQFPDIKANAEVDDSGLMRLLPVRCPECGKLYTRATAGSTVEVACRKCDCTTVVMVIAA